MSLTFLKRLTSLSSNWKLIQYNNKLFQNNGVFLQIAKKTLCAQQNLQAKSLETRTFQVKNGFYTNAKFFFPRSYFSLRSFFTRNYSTTPTKSSFAEKSSQIKKTFESISCLSEGGQREKMIISLAKEFGFRIEEEKITIETMKGFLEFTTQNNEILNFHYKELIQTPKWSPQNWNFALSILLRRFAMTRIDWLSFQRKEKLVPKVIKSMWRTDNEIPLYFPGKKEADKETGLEISIKKTKEWLSQNPNGRVTAIHEGIWDGNFLINLYIRLTGLNIPTNLVATDINPVSLALFILKCQLLEIPSEDFFTYFNSLHQPVNLHEIEPQNTSSLNTQILNIYFRVILDLEEQDALGVFEKKSKEMSPDDMLIVTLVEKTQNSLKAIQEAKLEKEEEGKFFIKYSKQSSDRESSILVLKKDSLQKLQAHLKEFFQLEIYEQKKVDICIDIGKRQSAFFEAVVASFHLNK